MLAGDKKEETFHPQIKKHPSVPQRTEQIFERLYRQRNNKENDLPCHTDSSFTPQITARGRNVTRDVPVTEHLYEDAKRRQEIKMKTSMMSNSKIEPEER